METFFLRNKKNSGLYFIEARGKQHTYLSNMFRTPITQHKLSVTPLFLAFFALLYRKGYYPVYRYYCRKGLNLPLSRQRQYFKEQLAKEPNKQLPPIIRSTDSFPATKFRGNVKEQRTCLSVLMVIYRYKDKIIMRHVRKAKIAIIPATTELKQGPFYQPIHGQLST